MLVINYQSKIVHMDRSKYNSDAEFYQALIYVKFNVRLCVPSNGIVNIRDYLKEKSHHTYNG